MSTAIRDRASGAHDRSSSSRSDRKRDVLKRSQASTVRSISGAVVIKDGDPFFLCPPDGQIPVGGRHGFGLYQHDTRFLAGYELRIVDVAPESLVATAAAGRTAILELTNPEIKLENGQSIGKERLAIRWTRALDGQRGRLTDRLEIRNYDKDDVTLTVHVRMAADFRDIFEIRGLLDEPPGNAHAPAWSDASLVLGFSGKDGCTRTLTATFDPPPTDHDGTGATFALPLPGRDAATMEITFDMAEEVDEGSRPIVKGRPEKRGGRTSARGGESDDAWVGGGDWASSVRSNSRLLDGVLRRSLADLDLLRARLDEHPYYVAGLPWFSALFGRDSLIVALQTLAWDPSMAAGTLRLLARRQGTEHDDWRDEEPGKILHELRVGELARLGKIPQTPYFGTVDATPLFLILLGEHASWTGSLDLFHELAGNVDRALGWIEHEMGDDGRTFLSYASTSDGGLANQGWKDSGDGIVDGQGNVATPPIALAEVQGYVYAAQLHMAELYERDGNADRADHLRRRAEALREHFEQEFWSERLGCYVMAIQGNGDPCSVVSSNGGQVLFSGIASADRAEAVERRLMSDDMFSGWGIRTLSSETIAYNPVGYHLGTVWPHDNSLIAAGFRRYGLDPSATRLLESLVEAAADFTHERLPECFAGLERDVFDIPVRYPVACHPQAWAAGSVPYLLTSTLGLQPAGLDGRLKVVRPRLPDFVDRLEWRGLTVGHGTVDLRFSRTGDGTTVEVGDVTGNLDVVVDQDSRRAEP
jgi:glycogen debranching enzyme